LKIGTDIIYQGELSGTITFLGASGKPFGAGSIVKIKLNNPKKELPDEILAQSRHFSELPFSEGDRVKIFGKIVKKRVNYWNKEYLIISAEHVWNEDSEVGW